MSAQYEAYGETVWGKIKFSNNWNGKLLNQAFTTIRKKSKQFVHGANYEVVLDGQTVKIAKLVMIETIQTRLLTYRETYVDAAMSRANLLKYLESIYTPLPDYVYMLTLLTIKDVPEARMKMLEAELRKAQQLTI